MSHSQSDMATSQHHLFLWERKACWKEKKCPWCGNQSELWRGSQVLSLPKTAAITTQSCSDAPGNRGRKLSVQLHSKLSYQPFLLPPWEANTFSKWESFNGKDPLPLSCPATAQLPMNTSIISLNTVVVGKTFCREPSKLIESHFLFGRIMQYQIWDTMEGCRICFSPHGF